MPDTVKPGADTSEHKVAKSANLWGSIATILGLILTFGSSLVPILGEGSNVGVIAGAVVTAAGIAQKTLVQLGYIKSRAEVKVAASLKK